MEFVYVVKRYDLFELSFPHGFVAAADDPRVAQWTARIRERGFFVERAWAENDSSLKQVIPYTLVSHGGQVFRTQRLKKGGEARLHGKLSLGIGGHINPVDGVPPRHTDPGDADLLDAGCRREIEEEIEIPGGFGLQTVGVINDESDDVGSVHFGLVHLARCETNAVTVRETEQLRGEFAPVAALQEQDRAEPGRFETWSAMILPHLDRLLANAPR